MGRWVGPIGALSLVLTAHACDWSETRQLGGRPDTRPDASPYDPGVVLDRDACLAVNDGSYLKLDVDGDGATAWWFSRCGEQQQIDVQLSGNIDCDDTDPTRSRKAWRDADGDGWGVSQYECFTSVPPGYLIYRPADPDCDDASGALQQTAYGDHDGDHYGDPNDRRCIAAVQAGSAYPTGVVGNAEDCDDADAKVNPLAFEQWSDGVDSDCDGGDDPLACGGFSDQCGCELVGTPAVDVDANCAGVDLFLVSSVTCRYCSGYSVLVIGNRGSAPVTGGFDIDTLHVAEDLPPGGVSHPISVRFDASQARLSTSATDCNPLNDEFPLGDTHGICDP